MQVFYGGLTNVDAFNCLENGTNETRTAEDGGRDDMFVDCPVEIENSESEQKYEGNENLQDNGFQESDSGINVQHLMTEMELLRDMFEKSIAEKDETARNCEVQSWTITNPFTLFACVVKPNINSIYHAERTKSIYERT